MEENWLPVVGCNGHYAVSDAGRVRNTRTGRLLKLSSRRSPRNGYVTVRVTVYDGLGKARTAPVSNLVLEAFVGPRPSGFECCHRNCDSSDNNLSNLRWDTPSANKLDSRVLGRIGGGTKKFSDADIRRIFCLRRGGLSYRKIAREIGTDSGYVSNVINGKCRRSVGLAG